MIPQVKKIISLGSCLFLLSACIPPRAVLTRVELESPQKILLVIKDVNGAPIYQSGAGYVPFQAGLLGALFVATATGLVEAMMPQSMSPKIYKKIEVWDFKGEIERVILAQSIFPGPWRIEPLSSFEKNRQGDVLWVFGPVLGPVKDERQLSPAEKAELKKDRERKKNTIDSLVNEGFTRILWVNIESYGLNQTGRYAYHVNLAGRMFSPQKKDIKFWEQEVHSNNLDEIKALPDINFKEEVSKNSDQIKEEILTHVRVAVEALTSDLVGGAAQPRSQGI